MRKAKKVTLSRRVSSSASSPSRRTPVRDAVVELHEVYSARGRTMTSLEWRGMLSELIKDNRETSPFDANDLAVLDRMKPGEGAFFNYGAGGTVLIRKPTKQRL